MQLKPATFTLVTMMRYLIPVLLMAFTEFCYAQGDAITAEGRVIDGLTRKGVKARIQYKSIPTGSITGRFNDSTFSFSIFGSSKYQIVATADGYTDGIAIVDPKTMDANRKVIRDITLTKKEREQVKQVAKDLLDTLKAERLVLDWRKQQKTRAAVRVAIFDALEQLPKPYTPELYNQKCELVYQHVYEAYATVPSPLAK